MGMICCKRKGKPFDYVQIPAGEPADMIANPWPVTRGENVQIPTVDPADRPGSSEQSPVLEEGGSLGKQAAEEQEPLSIAKEHEEANEGSESANPEIGREGENEKKGDPEYGRDGERERKRDCDSHSRKGEGRSRSDRRKQSPIRKTRSLGPKVDDNMEVNVDPPERVIDALEDRPGPSEQSLALEEGGSLGKQTLEEQLPMSTANEHEEANEAGESANPEMGREGENEKKGDPEHGRDGERERKRDRDTHSRKGERRSRSDRRKQSPSRKKRSPSRRRRSPSWTAPAPPPSRRRQSPNRRRRSPSLKRRSPRRRSPSPIRRRRSPSFERRSSRREDDRDRRRR